MKELKSQGVDQDKDRILKLVEAALEHKFQNQSYGRFTIEIDFKDGRARELAVSDKTTYKFA